MSPQSAPHGLTTPPFGTGRPVGSSPASNDPLPGYLAADFPAPAGVPQLSRAPRRAPRAPARLRTLLSAAVLSALIGAAAGVGSYHYLGGTGLASPISVTTVPAAQSPRLDGTVATAAATIRRSVVTIRVDTDRGSGVGTGVVLDAEGHLLTNTHVVEAAAERGSITVTFADGSTAAGRLVGQSSSNDLAVIKVTGATNLVPAVFARSDSVRVGQAVIAVGAPLGLSETVTSGIVSATDRPVRSGDNGDAVYLALQTDAAINPGNSGGPLVDLNGAVVGINSSIATVSAPGAGQSGNIGIGFAIPADLAVRVAGELIADGT